MRYVSKALHERTSSEGKRLPAREVEASVTTALAAALDDPLDLMCQASLPMDTDGFEQMFARAARAAGHVRARDREQIRALVQRVTVHPRSIEITVPIDAIAALLGTLSEAEPDATFTIEVPVRLTRTGRSLRLVHSDGSAAAATAGRPDPTLIKLLLKARAWWAILAKGELDIARLAAAHKVTPSYVTRIVRLAFLAPDLVEAILAGRQGPMLTGKTLADAKAVPTAWPEQRLAFDGAAVG